jgi:hypothetical protein
MGVAPDYGTAYQNEWRAHTDIFDADFKPDNRTEQPLEGISANPRYRNNIYGLKMRRGSLTRPIWTALAVGLSLSYETMPVTCWNPTNYDFQPQINDTFTVFGDDWVCLNVTVSLRSKWFMLLERKPVNVI